MTCSGWKKIVVIPFLLFVLASCTKQTFTIEGRQLDPSWVNDGDTVRLYFNRGDSMMVAETQVLGGQFVLTSFTTRAGMAQLQVGENEPLAVCVERGNVMLQLYENEMGEFVVRFKGTKNNDILGAFSDMEQHCFGREARTDTEKQQQIQNFADSVCSLLFSKPNMVATNYIFTNMYFLFTHEQRSRYFTLLTEDSRNDEDIRELYAVFEAESKVQVGMQFVDFSLHNLKSEKVSLSQLVGEKDYVLLDFWASWCKPCRELIPSLSKINKKYKERVQVVSVSVDSDERAWRKAVKENKMNWMQLIDEQNDEKKGAADSYGVMGIPTLFLIDKQGVIVLRDCTEEEIISYLNMH